MAAASGPRIAYLVKRFPRLSETFVLNEILELRRQGIAVALYALTETGERTVHADAAALVPEVVFLHDARGAWRRVRSWKRLLWGAALQTLRRPSGTGRVARQIIAVNRSTTSLKHAVEGLWLARQLRRRDLTHLHAHFAHTPSAVAHFASLAGGRSFSFTAHAKDLYTTLPRNVRIRAAAATFVVTCTEFNGRYLEQLSAGQQHSRIHVIHHGTDLSRYEPAARRAEPGLVLSVGRLVPKKGYQVLARALAIVAGHGIDFRWEVFGGGELRDELQRLSQELGIAERVRLHGAREHGEIVHAYRRASLFALAPRVMENGDRDGIPNVLVEAMASAVPVVSTRISGIPELIDDSVDGSLVPPDDPDALARALEELLTDDALAAEYSAGGRRKVERLFDLRANTCKLRELFETLDRPHAGVLVA